MVLTGNTRRTSLSRPARSGFFYQLSWHLVSRWYFHVLTSCLEHSLLQSRSPWRREPASSWLYLTNHKTCLVADRIKYFLPKIDMVTLLWGWHWSLIMRSYKCFRKSLYCKNRTCMPFHNIGISKNVRIMVYYWHIAQPKANMLAGQVSGCLPADIIANRTVRLIWREAIELVVTYLALCRLFNFSVLDVTEMPCDLSHFYDRASASWVYHKTWRS